jgi:hypothetical protein
MHCINEVVKHEGLRALYAGYSTTLLMNVPFHAIYVNIYEFLKEKILAYSNKEYDVKIHVTAGTKCYLRYCIRKF